METGVNHIFEPVADSDRGGGGGGGVSFSENVIFIKGNFSVKSVVLKSHKRVSRPWALSFFKGCICHSSHCQVCDKIPFTLCVQEPVTL